MVPSRLDSISSAPPNSFSRSRMPANPTPTFPVFQKRSRTSRGNPHSEILHSEDHHRLIRTNGDIDRATAGVAVHVSQSLLHNPEERNLCTAWKPMHMGWQIKFGCDSTALPKSVNIPFRRGKKPGLIKRRRMQKVGKRTRVGNRPVHQRARVAQMLGCGIALLREHIEADLCPFSPPRPGNRAQTLYLSVRNTPAS